MTKLLASDTLTILDGQRKGPMGKEMIGIAGSVRKTSDVVLRLSLTTNHQARTRALRERPIIALWMRQLSYNLNATDHRIPCWQKSPRRLRTSGPSVFTLSSRLDQPPSTPCQPDYPSV